MKNGAFEETTFIYSIVNAFVFKKSSSNAPFFLNLLFVINIFYFIKFNTMKYLSYILFMINYILKCVIFIEPITLNKYILFIKFNIIK